MNTKRKSWIAFAAATLSVTLLTATAMAQEGDSSGKSYLAKARAFSKMTGRPIFVVAGSKT